jgi:hypothetical protein
MQGPVVVVLVVVVSPFVVLHSWQPLTRVMETTSITGGPRLGLLPRSRRRRVLWRAGWIGRRGRRGRAGGLVNRVSWRLLGP